MKLLIATLLCWISFCTFSQKYVSDDVIDISGDPGNFTIKNYYTDKVYASHVQVDDFVSSVHHGLLGFQKGKKYGLINIYGKVVVPAIYDEFNRGEGSYQIAIRGDYFALRKGDQTALVDSTGAFAVPLGIYDYLWDAEQGNCGAERDGLFGLFRKGKAVLPMNYLVGYEYLVFNHETMPVGNDTLSGLINASGKLVLPVEYNYIGEFQDTYWQIEKNGLQGLADFKGKIVTPCSIDFIAEEHDGLIFGQKNGKYGVQKLDGTIVCPFEYDFMTTTPYDGAVFARKDNLWGYLDLAHPEKTTYSYTNQFAPSWRSNGLAFMEKEGLWGMINTKNEVVVDFLYTLPGSYVEFSFQLAFVMRNDLMGMISESGELVIPCEYEEIDRYSYFPKKVKKNGKYGYIEDDGTLLIPCDYDAVYDFHYEDGCEVERNGKRGIHLSGGGLIVPTLFDKIELNWNRYTVTLNGKLGLYDRKGKELLPCVFNEIYDVTETEALVKRDGILQRYDLVTGKEKAFAPDLAKGFEKTVFVNFGKTYVNEYETIAYNEDEARGNWYCVNKETRALIGKPYVRLGEFNEEGNAVALTGNYENPIAINSKGEELKPNFHLTEGWIFNACIFEDVQDSVIIQFQKRDLLKGIAPAEQWNYIQSNYHVTVTPQEYYDEYGDSYEAYTLACYEKDSYFDFTTPFPKNPKYAFRYYDFYSRTSLPNEQGWCWAVPIESAVASDYEVDLDFTEVVLVNAAGEVISRPNYHPVQSEPFHFRSYPQEVLWEGLQDYPETVESLKSFFPEAASLSQEEFLNRYKDSVYINYRISNDYSDELGETMIFETGYYKRKTVQSFYTYPPATIQYRFGIKDIKQVKGGEALNQPEFTTELILDSKTANTFGTTRYFVYPVLDEENGTNPQNTVNEYLQTMDNEEIKADLRQFDYYTKLIESGLATLEDYGSEGALQQLVADRYVNDLFVYSYESAVGLALENELLLQPKYLTIALDSTRSNGILETNFIAVDSLFNVFQFNTKNRKLTKLKDHRFCISKLDGLITQSKSTKLYNVYNKGYRTDRSWRGMYQLSRTYPVKDVKRFYFVLNCNMYPLINVYGEDSLSIDYNGVESYVYNSYCDTVVTGTYSRFRDAINYEWYEDVNGIMYRYDGLKDPVIRFSEYIRQNNIPINDGPLRSFLIRETPKGMELYHEDGKTIQLSLAEYEKLITQKEGDNGFGGVFKKGKFIAYDTFLPFPEKHEVYIHYNGNFWLVGTKNNLELILLDPTGETRVKKRYEKTFLSYDDFLERYFAVTASLNPVQQFMWSEYEE